MMRLFTFVALLFTLITTSALRADAEGTNSIDVNKMFDRAWDNYFTARGPIIADSLYNEGIRKGNLGTQCGALAVKTVHYFATGNTRELERTTEQLQKLSRREPYLYPYYYYAGLYVVYNYLYHRSSMKAMMVMHEMDAMAKKDDIKFGHHCVDLLNGAIYAYNGQISKALEKTDQAMEYAEDWADSLRVYSYKAAFYMELEKYDEVTKYSDKAYKAAHYDSQRFLALHSKCLALYLSERYAEFRHDFNLLIAVSKKLGNYSSNAITQIRVYNHLVNSEYAMAQQLVNTLDDSYLFDKIEVKKAQGKYGEALGLFMKNIRYVDSLSYVDTNSDMNEFDEQFGNMDRQRLLNTTLMRNAQMQQENIRLGKVNTELELIQTRARLELLDANKRNNLLELEKEYARLEKIKSEQKMKESQQKEVQAQYEHNRNILTVVIAALIIALILLGIYLYYKHTLEKKIDKKNKQLEEAYRMAEESIEKKKVFLKVISHEIRTPINAIVGFTDILTMPGIELEEEETRDMKERIRVNKLHLKTLMGDILDTKALETGNLEINMQETKVNDMCRSAISMIKKPCAAKGIKLSFITDVADDYTVMTDEQRLQQVLINYLTNAEKNTESGEIRLRVSNEKDTEWLTFSVEDTGNGVPEDKADTIFERFEKVNLFVQGTGMGLYMCRLIAKRLGGKAELDTSYKNGARFLFRLKKAMMMLLLLATMFTANAQPASQKDLQRLYNKAKESLKRPECLQLADDVFTMAGRMNDVDMQCKALYINVAYYQTRGKDAEMYRSCDRMKDFAKSHNMSYYYYLAWYTSINRLFLQSRTTEALEQLNEMRKQAYAENNVYGLARCHRAVANIYERNGNYSMAIKKFQDELKEIEGVRNLDEPDVGDIYERIGACQKYLGMYQTAAATFDKAIRLSKQPKTLMENKAWRAIVAFMLNDRGLFLKYYNELSRDNMAMNTMSQNVVRQLRMFYYIAQNDWKRAYEVCNVADPKAMDYMLLSDYYFFRGDTMRALDMKEQRLIAEQRRETDAQRRDLARHLSQMSKELMDIREEQLKNEQLMLSMNKDKLNLDKLNYEAKNARDNELREKALAENRKLTLEAQRSMIEKTRSANSMKAREQEEKYTKNRRNMIIMITAGVMLMLLLVFIFYIIFQRQDRLNILKEKNKQLQDALDKVHEADRLKDEFIKQMDEDVKEPLYTLTTYTRKIIDDVYENDEEGKQMAKDLVAKNAQHVLDIVTEAVEKAME